MSVAVSETAVSEQNPNSASLLLNCESKSTPEQIDLGQVQMRRETVLFRGFENQTKIISERVFSKNQIGFKWLNKSLKLTFLTVVQTSPAPEKINKVFPS